MRILSLMSMLALLLSASLSRAQVPSSNSVPVPNAPAAADSTGDGAKSQARMHFARGVEHYSEGNFDAALAELERAQELAPTYKILYNLGQVQMERHDNAAAIQLFTRYLHEGGAEIPEERSAAIAEDVARLRQRVAELSIEVDMSGVQIYVNDVAVGLSPLGEPVFVNVGKCRVRLEKAGYRTLERTFSIVGADQRRLSLSLEARAPQQPVAQSSEVGSTRNMIPFWLSLGGTVLLGGATATFSALTLIAHDDNTRVLASYPGRTGDLDAARGKLQTFATLTDVFAGATLVAGVATLYFLLSPPERLPPAQASGIGLRIAPTLTGTTLHGTF